MLAVLSPAKRLNLSPDLRSLPVTAPVLASESQVLATVLRALSPSELARRLKISRSLGQVAWEQYQNLDSAERIPAALLFDGDTYRGLDAPSLTTNDLAWAQQHLAILSGLYGVLRPLDEIPPYRLNMGIRLPNPRGNSLYAFWGRRIADQLAAATQTHDDPTVVNLSSNEYIKAIHRKSFERPLVDIVFKEVKPHKMQTIGFLVKKARGQMARWIVQNRITSADQLVEFAEARYTHRPELSTPDSLVFTRPFVSAADQAKEL